LLARNVRVEHRGRSCDELHELLRRADQRGRCRELRRPADCVPVDEPDDESDVKSNNEPHHLTKRIAIYITFGITLELSEHVSDVIAIYITFGITLELSEHVSDVIAISVADNEHRRSSAALLVRLRFE
jgi:hypothetical protein